MAAGEQISQVSGIHVEPTVMGHGGCSYHGHRTGQWWGKKYDKISTIIGWTGNNIFVVIRGSHQTGRISLVSSHCCLSTQLSVSLRKIMQGMLLRHLWLALRRKPRFLIIHLVCDISLYFPSIIFSVAIEIGTNGLAGG